MNPTPPPLDPSPTPVSARPDGIQRVALAGLAAWAIIAVGFLGLKLLMQERPQFTGQPLRTSKVHLVQRSPSMVVRRAGEDASVVHPSQPAHSDISLELRGRRDYRGLRTVMDMRGNLRATYTVSNAVEQTLYVLFRCPHPAAADGSREGGFASGLKLESSTPGKTENLGEAWIWSGELEPGESTRLTVTYAVSGLREITYRIEGPESGLMNEHRVSLRCEDLPALAVETTDGSLPATPGGVVWQRADFLAPAFVSARIVAGRQLYTSLAQLVEIGPIVSFLFLVAALAVIQVQQPLSPLQVMTLAAGYGLYFPLVLYLSSRFSFVVALTLAAAVPGVLLLNYARWLLGFRAGLIGGLVFLGLYQIFPTLAAFAGWNRGMVLLCLGTVTLAVLIQLQNRALRLRRAGVAALGAMLFLAEGGQAQPNVAPPPLQILLPWDQVRALTAPQSPAEPLVGFDIATYRIEHLAQHALVNLSVHLQVVRPADNPVPLFVAAPYLLARRFEAEDPGVIEWVTLKGVPAVLPRRTGQGLLELTYQVPVDRGEGWLRAKVPLLPGAPGTVDLTSPQPGLRVTSGALWSQTPSGGLYHYAIGVAGQDTLSLEWLDRPEGTAPLAGSPFYGIGILRSQHLTVVHSDASCVHFAEYELPVTQAAVFSFRLPTAARLVSVSVDGVEANPPTPDDGHYHIPLSAQTPSVARHRVSLRLACAPVRLAFRGTLEFSLPEVLHTAGRLQWVVALPSGFDLQILTSGLELNPTSADLPTFGDYGNLLQSQPHLNLTKDLAPPAPVSLQLHYRQKVPGFF